ncbi:MAG: succinate dehydrogenase assembly factor 2 [Gammaproteobacteria bacterium]|jgi:antitoxin CptB
MTQDQTDSELSRVRWQCRRGMLELDALLGDFVDQHYRALSESQRNSFRVILEYPDQMLFDYFFGDSVPIDKDVADVIQWIRQAVTPQT